jgi:hypothetical protein
VSSCDISPYEQLRLENIKRNKERLKALGLDDNKPKPIKRKRNMKKQDDTSTQKRKLPKRGEQTHRNHALSSDEQQREFVGQLVKCSSRQNKQPAIFVAKDGKKIKQNQKTKKWHWNNPKKDYRGEEIMEILDFYIEEGYCLFDVEWENKWISQEMYDCIFSDCEELVHFYFELNPDEAMLAQEKANYKTTYTKT